MQYSAKDIRNVAVVGHQACGKTMLSESMLVNAGIINRLGSITQGTTVSDYHEGEKKRQISIHSTLMNMTWQDKKFNLIDCPGYLDFISESLGALRVSDIALIMVDAVNGVELGTSQVWEFANRYDIPKMIIINGYDKEHTKFDEIIEDLRNHFGKNIFPMNVPVNAGPGFSQVLDVMRNEICTYQTDGSGTYTEVEATGDWAEKVKSMHGELIEYVAESDETLMETFFENDGLSEEQLREGLHTALENRSFIPVFCTSSESNVGVARLMDFIAKFGGRPTDIREAPAKTVDGKETTVSIESDQTAAYVFKTISEAHVGELSFIRVYAGSVKTGNDLLNSNRNTTERIGQIFTMNGKTREQIDEVRIGDICAVVKLKDTHTDDTLCDPKNAVILPDVDYPKPNIHGALRLSSKGDEDKISSGLSTIHEEDPTFVYRVDPETAQTVLSGQGELHLQVILDRLKRRYNIDVELTEPQIPYRETIKAKAEAKYRHKKQSGGAGQFGEVWMRIEPGERDSGIDFKESLVGQNVDRVFVPSVEKGVRSASEEGILAGCRVVDIKVDFYDGKMHPVDSKDVAFQIAGRGAFRDAFLKAKPCLLEPICNVSIKVPEECMGDVMGDISGRRGRIQGMDTDGKYQIINAQVPQSELYRYSTILRSMTGGRGLHTEEFSHYEELQRDQAEKVIAAFKKKEEE